MTNNPPRPGSPLNVRYTISKDDIEGMMKSGVPDEIVTAKFIDNAIRCQVQFKSKATQGWWIRVERKLYGEYYFVDTFIDHELVQYGPDWVDHHHQIIDAGFEAARQEHQKAKH